MVDLAFKYAFRTFVIYRFTKSPNYQRIFYVCNITYYFGLVINSILNCAYDRYPAVLAVKSPPILNLLQVVLGSSLSPLFRLYFVGNYIRYYNIISFAFILTVVTCTSWLDVKNQV